MLGITELWEAVIYRDKQLRENLENLNTLLTAKVGIDIRKNKQKKKFLAHQGDTSTAPASHEISLNLFLEGKSIEEIANQRGYTVSTIEWHIVKLYLDGKISIMKILSLTEMQNIQEIKKNILEYFPDWVEKLRDLKETIKQNIQKDMSYFDIHITLAMLEKKDI